MARRSRKRSQRYTWYETASGYNIVDNMTGEAAVMGDGVDMFMTETGRSISPGTASFDRAMNSFVRSSQAEIGEAYFQ